MKLNVFVDNERDADSYEGKIPAGHEHDRDAEDCSEDREGPVIILETWPPIGSLEEGEQSAGNVYKTVAHQKEHTEKHDIIHHHNSDTFNFGLPIVLYLPQKRCNRVNVSDKNSKLTNCQCHEESSGGFITLGEDRHWLEEWNCLVLGDGLKQSRRSCQGLEAGTKGGKERADLNDLWMRNSDISQNQAPAETLAEPEIEEIWVNNLNQYD